MVTNTQITRAYTQYPAAVQRRDHVLQRRLIPEKRRGTETKGQTYTKTKIPCALKDMS